MALVVEFTVTRPDLETSWPWEGISEFSQLSALREEHGATSSDSISADELSWTWTESCPMETGDAYFSAYSSFWEDQGVNSAAASSNVTVSSSVIEAS